MNHTTSDSLAYSASQAFGLTDGFFSLYNNELVIQISFNPYDTAFVGQLIHLPVANESLTRLVLSAREFDDTSHASILNSNFSYTLNIKSI